MPLSKLQKAVIQDSDGQAILSDSVALPELLPGTILVKAMAVALNPSDYKMGAAFPSPGVIIGSDVAGSIVAIGPNSTADLHVGDVVFGMVHGSNPADAFGGGFAQYVRMPSDLVLRVPPGYQIEEAAALGLGLAISCLALWGTALSLKWNPDNPSKEPIPVLVYGASTATGTTALQLLRLSGLDPIATCSPHNFEMVRSYGAKAVFDYKQPDTPENIRKEAGGRLRYALDCITDPDSISCCYASISRTGGYYASLELCAEKLQTRRAVKADFPMAYEIFGRKIQLSGGYYREASQAKHNAALGWYSTVQRLLNQGKLRSHPIKVLPGGLDAIPEGLRMLRTGDISGQKLVVHIE
ncbi:putative zinc-binding dehydrogenase family oxidoreductase [Hypoxylon sp. NC1633]|nr:putative zinc-binding dehydrogenase family oxidoreductase [Hypoxylon sp. NC1633]